MYYKALVKDYRVWDEVEKIESVTKFLEENKDKITALELSSNSLSEVVAVNLALKIKLLPYLQYVNYNDIFVSRKKDQIPNALKELFSALINKPVRILNISNNAFGPIGVKSIDFFIKSTKNLMELYIENCGLGPEGSESLANLLMENKHKLNLEVLVINRNRLENKGAAAFAMLLTKLKTLERVELAHNGIEEEGFPDLFNSFKENPNLRIVNVDDNTVKKSVKVLIEALPALKKLQVLKISDCLVGEQLSLKLFETLKDHENLKVIECNYNEIENPKAQEKIFEILVSGKDKFKNLKKLTLKGNEIDKDLYKKYNKQIAENFEEFVAYSDEELEADLYDETEEDEFGNVRKMKDLKIK